MRRKRIEVNFNDLIEIFFRFCIYFWISGKVFCNLVCGIYDFLSSCCSKVSSHRIVITKGRSCGADLGSHVADGSFSGTTHGSGTFTEILHDASGSTFYGKDSGNFQDYVFWSSPAI